LSNHGWTEKFINQTKKARRLPHLLIGFPLYHGTITVTGGTLRSKLYPAILVIDMIEKSL